MKNVINKDRNRNNENKHKQTPDKLHTHVKV